MSYTRIVATGSIAYDHIMSMPGKFRDHIMPDKMHLINVSFTMESFREEFGGTAGNVAYALGQLGTKVLLAGTAGSDFDPYRQHLLPFDSIDLSGVHIYPDATCSQGFVMTDYEDNQIWGFYAGAMHLPLPEASLTSLTSTDLVLIGPNKVETMIQIAKHCVAQRIDYAFDPAFIIPNFKPEALGELVRFARIVFGNDYEMELLRRSLRWSEAEFYDPHRIVVTTLGSKGSLIRVGQEETSVPAVSLETVTDPTGAGDAYRAGFLASYAAGGSVEQSAQLGSVMSSKVVSTMGTQTYKTSKEAVMDEVRAQYGGDGLPILS